MLECIPSDSGVSLNCLRQLPHTQPNLTQPNPTPPHHPTPPKKSKPQELLCAVNGGATCALFTPSDYTKSDTKVEASNVNLAREA